MSIQSEITRIAGNVSEALTEISNKGVVVPVGSNSDDLATLIAQITGGGGSAIVITDTIDPVSGGTIRTITAVSLSGDTVTASVLLNGYTAHDANGNAITGTYVPPAPSLQSKTISPTESQQTVSPSTGYDGLSSVTVNAIDSNYVGSGVTRRDSTDLSASGDTVTAPAGYYASSASKSVASGSAATPATTITATPTISVNSSTGVITASVSASQSVTPTVSAGYVSAGAAGTITASGSDTEQMSVQAAQTIHPSTSDQTIASGRYLTGNQTIKAVTVSGLSASNILSGVTVKIGDSTDDDCVMSVSGSVSFQTIYSGSSAPSPSQGVNGDIYIQT